VFTIRDSIEAKIDFFSQRNSGFLSSFNSRTAIRDLVAADSPTLPHTMVYRQISRPMNFLFADKESEILWRGFREKDIEIYSISVSH
jgi:hypothetical protein